MKRREIIFITEVAILSALGLVFDYLGGIISGFAWPNGGSVSLVLLPIIIMAYRWGLKGGLVTGLIIGTVQIMWASKSGFVHPIQVALDYAVAYGIVGLAGIFSKKIKNSVNETRLYYVLLGIILGGSLRTIIHIFTGAIYFITFDNGVMSSLVASTVYNLGYMVPTIIITAIALHIIVKKQPRLLNSEI